MNAPATASTAAALATLADADELGRALEPDELVRRHIFLVHAIAKKAHRHFAGRVDYDELVALGSEGLVEASRRYDPSAGASFKTFAYYRIRGAMFDGVGAIAPLPRSVYRRRRCAATTETTARTAPCAPAELASEEDPAAEVQRQQVRALLERAIASLPEDKQHLVRACYFGGATLLDAGKQIGISKSWACRMHSKALQELRIALANLDVDEI